MTVIIEEGVPLPQSKKALGIAGVLRSLNVGDSFVVPLSWNLASLRTAAYQNFPDRKFSIRNIDGHITRVWRVA